MDFSYSKLNIVVGSLKNCQIVTSDTDLTTHLANNLKRQGYLVGSWVASLTNCSEQE